jgi:hypothetical protein
MNEMKRWRGGWAPAALIGGVALAAGAAWLSFRKSEPDLDARTRQRLAPKSPSMWRGTDADPSS